MQKLGTNSVRKPGRVWSGAIALRVMAAVLLIASAACGSGGKDAAPETGTPFESAAGKFSAEFPSEPKEQTENQTVFGMDLAMHFFLAESDDYGVAVAYVDYPSEVTTADPKAILGGAAGGAAGNVPGGELTKTTYGKFAGADAIDYEISGDGFEIQAKAFLVGPRLYQLQAVSETLADADAEYDRLVKTFKLL